MELRQLEYFVRVAELGSMTRAAAALGVTQAALSRHLLALERELDVALLIRNGRGVVLTDSGSRLLSRARTIAAEVAATRDEASALRDHIGGTVTVAMAPSAGALLWLPLIQRLEDTYPDIRLEALEGYSADVTEWLVSGRADVGVLYDPSQSPHLKVDVTLSESLHVVAATAMWKGAGAQLRLADLPALPLILPGRNHAIRRLLEQAVARIGLKLDPRVEVNAYPAIRKLVGAGRYCTVLPLTSVTADVPHGSLVSAAIIEPELRQTVGVVSSSHHKPLPATRVVCSLISTLTRALIESGEWPARLLE